MDSQLIVERVTGGDDTSALFKSFTNKVVGRGLIIPDNNEVFFGYRVSHGGVVKILVCVGTVRPALAPSLVKSKASPCSRTAPSADTGADIEHCCSSLQDVNINTITADASPSQSSSDIISEPDEIEKFLNDESHIIEYLFTDSYYRRNGYGGNVLAAMVKYCLQESPESPFRLWAASKARGFFRRNGFKLLSNTPSESRHSIMIFQHLYPMERTSHSVESSGSIANSNRRNRQRRRRPHKTSKPNLGPPLPV